MPLPMTELVTHCPTIMEALIPSRGKAEGLLEQLKAQKTCPLPIMMKIRDEFYHGSADKFEVNAIEDLTWEHEETKEGHSYDVCIGKRTLFNLIRKTGTEQPEISDEILEAIANSVVGFSYE